MDEQKKDRRRTEGKPRVTVRKIQEGDQKNQEGGRTKGGPEKNKRKPKSGAVRKNRRI